MGVVGNFDHAHFESLMSQPKLRLIRVRRRRAPPINPNPPTILAHDTGSGIGAV